MVETDTGMRSFRLQLLGGFRLTDEQGDEIELASRKGQALLAFLALSPDSRSTRSRLASLLWGGRFDDQARASLRQCLFELRKTLQDEDSGILATTGETVVLDPERIWCDVRALDDLVSERAVASLSQAADLAGGELLSGFELAEAEFADWLGEARARMKGRAEEVLSALAEQQAQTGDSEAAIVAAQRLVALDPLREDGHRLLMRLFHQTGRRNDALRQYQACCDVVRDTLDVEPEPETTALYERIRGGEPEAVSPPEPAPSARAKKTPVAKEAAWKRIWRALGWRYWAAFGGIAATAGIAFALVWLFWWPPDTDLPLPDKPSIAVLPFENLSGDPDQGYFSDGMTVEIITKLARVPDFFVIARHSVFSYKGKPVKVQQVSKELGVRYVVEGSVQQAEGRVRIVARLADALSGSQLWAETFDHDMSDIFELQDRVARNIVGAIEAVTTKHGLKLASRKDTRNLKAYDYVLKGRDYLYQVTPAANKVARQLYHRALRLDPDYARAHAYLAWTYLNDWRLGWTDDPEAALGQAFQAAQRAVSLDDFIPDGHEALGDTYLWMNRHDLAIKELNRAVDLNPSGASSHVGLGDILIWSGRAEEAMPHLETAMRLNPHYPFFYLWYLGHAQFMAERYDAAVETFLRLRDRKPDFLPAFLYLAATYSLQDRAEDAKAALAIAKTLNPRLSRRLLMVILPYKDPAHRERVIAALEQADLDR